MVYYLRGRPARSASRLRGTHPLDVWPIPPCLVVATILDCVVFMFHTPESEMSSSKPLDLATLTRAVGGEGAALRLSVRLQPAGGTGDKVFPPTYAVDKGKIKYAMETRMIDGSEVATVLLDSVASQANRIEEALLGAWDADRVSFPVISVDFSAADEGYDGEHTVADLDRVTTLQAPHRIADAILRDAVTVDGTRFRDSPPGKSYTAASTRTATAVFQYCPTALVFGVWDSTGPKGGMGNKIQRALVSEIVGFGVKAGVKTASRLDPAGIQRVPIFHDRADRNDWTAEPSLAAGPAGRPERFSRKGDAGDKGFASAANHGNIAPSIVSDSGGVTMDYAKQTTVVSLVALRRLGFQTNHAGAPLSGDARRRAELAVRTALAALGLAGIALARDAGYDLRSRSLLIPESATPLEIEIVPAVGGPGVSYSLDSTAAAALLSAAAEVAAANGFAWERSPLALKPAAKLVALIRESRRLAAEGKGGEEEAT